MEANPLGNMCENTDSTKDNKYKFFKYGAIICDKGGEKCIVKNDMQNCLSEINEIKIQIEQLNKSSQADVEQVKAKCSRLNERFMALLNRLDFTSGSEEEPIHKYSHNRTPELIDLLCTLHIIDAQRLVPINTKSWSTPYSHYTSLATIIGGTDIPGCDYITEIIQLPPVEENGKLRYPVNVMYISPLKRQIAVKKIQQHCHRNKISLPIQYSLFRYPTLKHNVHILSTILRDLQDKGKIEFYHINDFMATNYADFLAPMFIVKIPGTEGLTEYKECPTNSLYHSGLYIPEQDKDMTSDEYLFFKQTIQEFVYERLPKDEQETDKTGTDNSWTEVTYKRDKQPEVTVNEKVQSKDLDVIREDSKIYRPMNLPKQQIINKYKQKKGYRVALLGDKGKEVKDGGGKGEGGSGGRGLQGRGEGAKGMHNGDKEGMGTQHTRPNFRGMVIKGGGGVGNRGGGKGEWIGARGEGDRRGGKARVFNYTPLGQHYKHENKDDYMHKTPKSRYPSKLQHNDRFINKPKTNLKQNLVNQQACSPPVCHPPTSRPPLRSPPARSPPLRSPPLRSPPARNPPLRSPPARNPPTRSPPTQHYGNYQENSNSMDFLLQIAHAFINHNTN
jgi:hypothetical protein